MVTNGCHFIGSLSPYFPPWIPFAVFVLLLVFILGESQASTILTKNQTAISIGRRPIIHTFFERIPLNERFTGMTDEADDALLDFWKQTWFAAGWEPRVITLADAKKHEDYDSFSNQLNKINLDEFSRLSFFRWIAMSAVGGGFLVDYDAFPIRDFVQEGLKSHKPGDKFILYDNFLSPTLASGSASMWHNMGKALLENSKQHVTTIHSDNSTSIAKKTFWTDTMGLLELSRASPPNQEFLKNIRSLKVVVDGGKALKSLDQYVRPEDCTQRPLRGRPVIHFSVSALYEGVGVKPEYRHPQHRLSVAREFFQEFSIVCTNETKWEMKR